MNGMDTSGFIETILRTDDEDAVPNDVAERRTSNGNSREEIATTVNSIGKSILNGSLPLTNRPLSNIMNGHSNQVNGKRTRGNSICDVIVLSSSDEDELGKNDSAVASKRNKIENTVLAKGGGGGGGSGNSVSVGVIESGIKKIVSTPRAVQTNGFPSDSPPITQTTKDLMTQQQQRQWLQQPQQTVPVNVPSCSLEPEVVLTVEGKAINRPLPHALSPNGTRPLLVTSSATTNTSSSPSSLLTASGSPLKKIKLIVKKSGVPNKANAATCAATAAAHQLAIASKSLSTIVDDQVRMTSVTPTKITHIQTTVTPSIATVDDYSYPLPPTSQKRTTMRKTGKKQDSKSTKDEDIEVLSVSSSDDESERIEKAKNETKDDWRSTVFEISDDDDDDNDDNDNITNATKKTPSREKVNLFEKENKNIFLMCDKQFHSLKIKMKTNWMVLSDSNFFLEKKGFYNKMSEFSDLKFSHLFHWVLSKRLFYIKDTFRMPKYFILKNSIFDLAKSPKVILELVSHWVLQTEASIITKKLNVDMEFLRGFYQTLRAVCTLSLTYKKFATKKDVVELGVISLQTHFKNNGKKNTLLIVGAFNVSKKTFRYFLLSNTVSNATSAVTNANIANQIGNCNLRTLKSILECWFEKTCVIFMDDRLNRSLLKGYNVFSELKNPSKNYNIKHSLERRLLLLFQGKIHSLESSLIQQFLDELAWRDEFGRSYDDLLKSIIECIQFQTKKYANKNFILFINSVAKNPQEFLIEPNFNVTDKHPKQKESDQNSYIHIKCTESRAEKLSAQTIHGELLHQQQLHPQTADMRLLSSTRTTSAAAAAAAAATAKSRNNAAPVTRSSQRASSTSSTNSSSSVSTTASRTMPSRAVNNKCDNEQKKLQSVRHLLLKKKTLQPLLTRSATLNSVENAKCMEKAFFGYKFGRRSEIFSKSDQLYNCAKCKRSFSDNIKFLDHLNASIFNSHNETELNLCRYCLHRFNNAKDLKRHIDTKHPLTILGSEDCFSCPICETVYSTMLEIRSHLNDSHPPYELPYKCHVCSFMCYSHRLAVDHFYFEHKGFGLIQCPLCLYCVSFRRENVFNNFKSEIESYTSHIRKHLTSKPFKCNKCVLIFNSLEEVSKHNEEGHAEAQKDVVQFNNFQNWVIQNLLCFECNDSLFLNMGHLKVPSKCEKCNYSTNCRKAFSFHSCKKAKRLQLDEEMVCLCGFKSSDGFELAKHLVQCEHKTVYGSASEADFILSGGQYLVSLGLERK